MKFVIIVYARKNNETGVNIMNCENNYCIYSKDDSCILNSVSIDSLGMCDDCIIISLDEDFLKAEKTRQLNELEARWDRNETRDD